MGYPKSYQGFWGLRSGEALEELARFLAWNKDDWADFVSWMDQLEKIKKDKKKIATSQAWRNTVRSLKGRQAIITRTIGGRVMVRLSDKGWRAACVRKLRAPRGRCRLGWCIVVFDFPETERHARDMFRRLLQECGFDLLQRSVFVSDRDVARDLTAVIEELGLVPWVAIFEGQLMGGEMMVEIKRPSNSARSR